MYCLVSLLFKQLVTLCDDFLHKPVTVSSVEYVHVCILALVGTFLALRKLKNVKIKVIWFFDYSLLCLKLWSVYTRDMCMSVKPLQIMMTAEKKLHANRHLMNSILACCPVTCHSILSLPPHISYPLCISFLHKRHKISPN